MSSKELSEALEWISSLTTEKWKTGFFPKQNALVVMPAHITDGQYAEPVCLITPLKSAAKRDKDRAAIIAALPDILEALGQAISSLDTIATLAGKEEKDGCISDYSDIRAYAGNRRDEAIMAIKNSQDNWDKLAWVDEQLEVSEIL